MLHRFYLLIKQAGADDGLRHTVRVTVCCRAAVLKVAPLLQSHLARDADAGTTVGHSRAEVLDAAGLMKTRETSHVVLAPTRVVHLDVLHVFLAQLLDGLLDVSFVRKQKETAERRNASHVSLPVRYGHLANSPCCHPKCVKDMVIKLVPFKGFTFKSAIYIYSKLLRKR